ncbi:MAG: glycosyltransferase family 2 protein [Anaerolineae bacterium]|nr:MAG: glycosyltransferase family 2 protein [Anaerolineae bacterium]
MKLVININCYNEAQTLPGVLAELPHALPGVNVIEVQVVDDGSQDGTAYLARRLGARVVQHTRNRGLGAAFRTAVDAALASGADIMVNMDGDGQYPGWQIGDLIQPIRRGGADIVIGNRTPWAVPHFNFAKRVLQRAGNAALSLWLGMPVLDAVSGFRAFSAHALLRLNPVADFSFVLDTLIQARYKSLRVAHVPVAARPPTRPSRLYRSLGEYLWRTLSDVLRVTWHYRRDERARFHLEEQLYLHKKACWEAARLEGA